MATVYRQTANGLETRQGIHSVDLQPYLNDGWALSPPVDAAVIEVTPSPGWPHSDINPRLTIEARLAELKGLAADWRQIKPVAESHGIEKPADGWDASVLPILVAEYGQSAAEEIYTKPV